MSTQGEKTVSKTYVVVPADVQPYVVCELNGHPSPEWLLLEGEAKRDVEIDGRKTKEPYNPRIEFLNTLNPGDELYAPLGGPGDGFLAAAATKKVTIRRITHIDLARYPYKGGVKVPDTIFNTDSGGEKKRHQERCQRVANMVELVQAGATTPFRPYLAQDVHISMLRVYIGQLLALQDEIRKRLQQRTIRLDREQAFFDSLPEAQKKALDTNFQLIELQGPIQALLDNEKELERAIMRQLRQLDVWTKVFEPIRGMGPRIAARIIGSIVDIGRFDQWRPFNKYCGWHTIPDEKSGRRIAARFVHGESGGFHERVRMGWWLFGEQVLRSNSQFRWFYDSYKAEHEKNLGKTIEERGHTFTFTKGWLHDRAVRYAVSKATKYVYHGWRTIEGLPCEFQFLYEDWLDPEKHWARVVDDVRARYMK